MNEIVNKIVKVVKWILVSLPFVGGLALVVAYSATVLIVPQGEPRMVTIGSNTMRMEVLPKTLSAYESNDIYSYRHGHRAQKVVVGREVRLGRLDFYKTL